MFSWDNSPICLILTREASTSFQITMPLDPISILVRPGPSLGLHTYDIYIYVFGRFLVGFRSCMDERESVFCINDLQATFPPNIMLFIIPII